MARNEELWGSVASVLDLAEELESLISRMIPGDRSKPLARILDDLVQTISDAQANLRQHQADSDLPAEERSDCDEGVEAFAGLLRRLERTRQHLKSRISRNKKRLLTRMIACSVIPAVVSFSLCSWFMAAYPELDLIANMAIGLGVGIFFGVLFVYVWRWWDRPAKTGDADSVP